MTPISQEILDAIEDGMYIPCRLFAIVSPLSDDNVARFTDASTDIWYDGNMYSSRGIQFTDINDVGVSAVSEMTFSIDDTDQFFLEFLGEAGNEQPRAEISMAILDRDTFRPIDIARIFTGYLNGWSIGSNVANITLASTKYVWFKQPLSKYTASCRWRIFGGVECTYPALPGDVCGRTYEECARRSNTHNFGGFRFLPTLQKKSIWWGRVPKES